MVPLSSIIYGGFQTVGDHFISNGKIHNRSCIINIEPNQPSGGIEEALTGLVPPLAWDRAPTGTPRLLLTDLFYSVENAGLSLSSFITHIVPGEEERQRLSSRLAEIRQHLQLNYKFSITQSKLKVKSLSFAHNLAS